MSAVERTYEMTDNGGSPYRVWYRARPGLTMGVAECGTKRDAEMIVAALNSQGAFDEIDVLINEVLDQWTWPIRTYGEMRGWLARLSDAVKRGQGHPPLASPSTDAPNTTTEENR